MNRRQLQKLGVPLKFAAAAIDALRHAATQDLGFGLKGKRAKDLMQEVVRAPETFLHDPIWGKLATEMLGHEPIELRAPIPYRTWGEEIDEGAHACLQHILAEAVLEIGEQLLIAEEEAGIEQRGADGHVGAR